MARRNTIQKSQKKPVAQNAGSRVRSKKVSIKQMVQRAAGILKKPFKKKKKMAEDGVEETSKDQDVQLGSSVKKQSARKKEKIVIDYPEPILDEQQTSKPKRAPRRKNKKADDDKDLAQSGLIESKEDEQSFDSDSNYEDERSESEKSQSSFSKAVTSEVNGFFYTSDKFISRFEDEEMVQKLKETFPLFMLCPSDLQTQKKQIIEMLSNAKFMDDFLSYYDMTIYDFFKFLFRLEPDLFKGTFLKRIQKTMRYKKYAINAKKTSHFERKRARLKALSQARKQVGGQQS